MKSNTEGRYGQRQEATAKGRRLRPTGQEATANRAGGYGQRQEATANRAEATANRAGGYGQQGRRLRGYGQQGRRLRPTGLKEVADGSKR
ncbi:unnamed protein product [Arctogadus glacialis]